MTDPKLEKPLIIWTLQRTGGTNLSRFLNKISVYKRAQDEPFNGLRQFGHITKAWRADRDQVALDAGLAEIMQDPKNIKHCVERVPVAISIALAEASVPTDYQHLFLYRINPVGRLLSMEYAERTRVWGPGHEVDDDDDWAFEKPLDVDALIEHEKVCNRRLNRIWRLLVKAGKRPAAISFEELYSMDDRSAKQGVKKAFKRMDVALELGQLNEIVQNLRSRGNQKTSDRYAKFKGRDELEKRIGDVAPLIFQVDVETAD